MYCAKSVKYIVKYIFVLSETGLSILKNLIKNIENHGRKDFDLIVQKL